MIYLPRVWLAGLGVAFFGSLLYAATYFPHGYDWRYSVMSSLSDPQVNPKAYRIAAGGMAVSGVLLALLGSCIRTTLQNIAPSKWTNVACAFFVLGGLLITISAILTPGLHPFLGLPKAHAKFAQAGTFSYDLGMVLTLPALLALPPSKKWTRRLTIFSVLVPVTAYLVARILLPTLVDPNSIKPGAYPPLLGSLSFWEWAGSVTVYLYTSIIILALSPTPSSKTRI